METNNTDVTIQALFDAYAEAQSELEDHYTGLIQRMAVSLTSKGMPPSPQMIERINRLCRGTIEERGDT